MRPVDLSHHFENSTLSPSFLACEKLMAPVGAFPSPVAVVCFLSPPPLVSSTTAPTTAAITTMAMMGP